MPRFDAVYSEPSLTFSGWAAILDIFYRTQTKGSIPRTPYRRVKHRVPAGNTYYQLQVLGFLICSKDFTDSGNIV
jgi:hypothetical protein